MNTPAGVAAEVAQAMAAASRGVATGTRKAMQDAAVIARRNAPVVRFRNMGGKSTGVTVDISDDEITVHPHGPVGILEPGARPHAINSGRPMRVRGGFRRGPFRHPGTPDTHKWSDGMDATFAQVERDLPESVGDAVEQSFGG